MLEIHWPAERLASRFQCQNSWGGDLIGSTLIRSITWPVCVCVCVRERETLVTTAAECMLVGLAGSNGHTSYREALSLDLRPETENGLSPEHTPLCVLHNLTLSSQQTSDFIATISHFKEKQYIYIYLLPESSVVLSEEANGEMKNYKEKGII